MLHFQNQQGCTKYITTVVRSAYVGALQGAVLYPALCSAKEHSGINRPFWAQLHNS